MEDPLLQLPAEAIVILDLELFFLRKGFKMGGRREKAAGATDASVGWTYSITTRTQFLPFAFLCALSIAFWLHPLVGTFRLALANDAYTHILLILPLSAALIYLDSKYLDSKAHRIDPQSSRRIGAALLALSLLTGCYARWGIVAAHDDVRLTLSMLALVTWWIASVLLCFGTSTFQSFMFPLCSVLDRSDPRVCCEVDRRIPATVLCVDGVHHVSSDWGPRDAGWNHVVYPGTGYRGRARVQQHPIQLNAVRDDHGSGASFPALLGAESRTHRGGDSAGGRQERPPYFCHRRTRNSG